MKINFNLLKPLEANKKATNYAFDDFKNDLEEAKKEIATLSINDDELNKKITECENILAELKLLPKKTKKYKKLLKRDGLLKICNIQTRIFNYNLTRIQNMYKITNKVEENFKNKEIDLYDSLVKAIEFAELLTPEELEEFVKARKEEEKKVD